MTRVLVCGGYASFADFMRFNRVMDRLHQHRNFSVVIEGGTTGADHLAAMWARKNAIPTEKFRADWAQLGVRAGPIRNQMMLNDGKPDLVVAAPGGYGTRDMIRRALAAKVQVVNFVVTDPC